MSCNHKSNYFLPIRRQSNHFNKVQNIIPRMREEAERSPIRYRLAAGIIKNGKFINRPTHNTNGEVIRGCRCSSLHAEHRAMLKAFPNLQYKQGRWCFLQSKRKGSYLKKGQQKPDKG